MPKFDASTILGIAAAVFVALGQMFPQKPWLAELGGAITAIVLQEKKTHSA